VVDADFLTKALVSFGGHVGFFATQSEGKTYTLLRLEPHTADLAFEKVELDAGALALHSVYCQRLRVGYVLDVPPNWRVAVEPFRARFFAQGTKSVQGSKTRQVFATQDLVLTGAGDYAYLGVTRPKTGLYDARFSHTQLDFEV
jgi:hypothetical protein